MGKARLGRLPDARVRSGRGGRLGRGLGEENKRCADERAPRGIILKRITLGADELEGGELGRGSRAASWL